MLSETRRADAPAASAPPSAAGGVLTDPLVDPTTLPEPPARREVTEAGSRGVQTSSGETGDPPITSTAGRLFAAGDQEGLNAQLKQGENRLLSVKGQGKLPASAGTGSAFIAPGADASGNVHDALSASVQYRAEKLRDPDATEAELWERATRHDLNPGGGTYTLSAGATKPAPAATQGPYGGKPIAQMLPDNTTVANKPNTSSFFKKRALVVANSVYPDNSNWGSLSGAAKDAKQMAAQLNNEGYDVTEKANLTAKELKASFDTAASGLGPNDELTLYYAGHGISTGLVGTNSVLAYGKPIANLKGIYPHADLAKHATKAVSGGYHTRIITDACESQALIDAVAKAATDAKGTSKITEERGNPYHNVIDDKREPFLNKALQEKGSSESNVDERARVMEGLFGL